jgi:hypothetical protein
MDKGNTRGLWWWGSGAGYSKKSFGLQFVVVYNGHLVPYNPARSCFRSGHDSCRIRALRTMRCLHLISAIPQQTKLGSKSPSAEESLSVIASLAEILCC